MIVPINVGKSTFDRKLLTAVGKILSRPAKVDSCHQIKFLVEWLEKNKILVVYLQHLNDFLLDKTL